MLFWETVDVYCKKLKELRDTLCVQNVGFVPHRKHYFSATKTNRLMLFGERITIYCENNTGHTDTLCVQNIEFPPHRKHNSSQPQLRTG
jgi:hypothetical protein